MLAEDTKLFVKAAARHLVNEGVSSETDSLEKLLSLRIPELVDRPVGEFWTIQDAAIKYLCQNILADWPADEAFFYLSKWVQGGVKAILDAAKWHGMDSELDHEIGDLQDAVREAFDLLSVDQKEAVVKRPPVSMMIDDCQIEAFVNALFKAVEQEAKAAEDEDFARHDLERAMLQDFLLLIAEGLTSEQIEDLLLAPAILGLMVWWRN